MASINNSTLYPPIMDTYQDAIVKEDIINKGKGIKINFTISNYTNIADINEIQVIIKTQDGVNSILKNEIYFYSDFSTTPLSNNNITIEIPNSEINKEKLKIDEYYRVQVRFSKAIYSPRVTSIENYLSQWVNSFSEWSSISLIKVIPASSVSIEQSNFGNRGKMNYLSSLDEISGSLIFSEQTSEYLLNYRIKVFENPNNDSIEGLMEKTEPIEDSGELSASIYKKDYFYYLFKYDFSKGMTYNFIIEYETNNSFKDNLSFPFRIIESKIEPLISKSIESSNVYFNKSKGCNIIKIDFNKGYSGKIIIRRTDSKSNYKKFEDIYISNIFQTENSSWIWSDYTVESGIMYKYAIQEKDVYNNRSQKYYLNNDSILVELDDIFLIDKDNILKIKFDPTISGYRKVTKDGLIETIGSQYPFMTRNAATNYKTFSLNGTISWDSDIFEELIQQGPPYMSHFENENINEEVDLDFNRHLFANLTKLFSFEDVAREYREIKNDYNRHKDYTIEKLFREMVLDYLNNGKPKLYKSLTEGNIIIKITDVTLEPKIELGRFIFSFSCIATEIDDNTIDNYKLYNIIYYKEEQEDFTIVKRLAGQIETPNEFGDYDILDLIKNKYEYNQDGSKYLLQNLTKIIISPRSTNSYQTFVIKLNGKDITCFGTFELKDANIESLSLKQSGINSFVIQYVGDYVRQPYYIDTEVNDIDSIFGEIVTSIEPETSLVKILKEKYNYDENNFRRSFISLDRAFVSVVNKDQYNQESSPGKDLHFVFEVKDFDIESQESDFGHKHNTIHINDDEFLDLFDKNYLIDDLIYKGIYCDPPTQGEDYLKFKNCYYEDVVAQYQSGEQEYSYYDDFTIFKAKDFIIEEGYSNYNEEDESLYHVGSNPDTVNYTSVQYPNGYPNYENNEWYFAHAVEKEYVCLGGKLYEYDSENGVVKVPADIIFDYICEIERSQTKNV